MPYKVNTFSGLGERLREVISPRSQAAFARQLGIPPQQLTRYLSGKIPDPKVLARIAEVTGRSIDWLLLGRGASEVLAESAAQLKELGGARKTWRRKRSELAHTLSQTEYAMMVSEAAEIAAEAPGIYKTHATTILALIEHIRQLTPEEQETLSRFLEALRSDDAQVKEHLINQMKVVERALMTRRTRTKKSESA